MFGIFRPAPHQAPLPDASRLTLRKPAVQAAPQQAG